MPCCAVFGCSNNNRKTKDTDIKYFSFPKDLKLCKQWLNACSRKDKINLQNARICSLHFNIKAFEIPLRQQLMNFTPKNARNLHENAIPTENLPLCKLHLKRKLSERAEKRLKKLCREEVLHNITELNTCSSERSISSIDLPNEVAIEDVTNADFSLTELQTKIVSLESQIIFLNSEITTLKEKNQVLVLENETLKSHKNSSISHARLHDLLKKIFTKGQLKMILNPNLRKVRWSADDISSAISLRSVSAKAYRYLRKLSFPLPALSSLRTWALQLHTNEGLLHDVLLLMGKKSTNMLIKDKLTVLTFDEIYISNKICIDRETESKLGPHTTCQTVMARGLLGNWKQPVFYKFDQPMTKEIMNNIISKLYSIGFVVVAITSDMGGGNKKFWSTLNIGHDHTKNHYISHPDSSSLKVHVFADAPHLLKLVRNHMIDQGFSINGKSINKNIFEEILNMSSNEITIAHKLTKYHLDVKGSERQKVRPAAQLFSNTVSKAITFCGERNYFQTNNWEETANFVKLVNDWFDIFNSRTKYDGTSNAFGIDIENQLNILDKMSETISNMTVGKHKTLIPFQKGILLNNVSLRELYKYLSKEYNIEYILTSRLNQDILENFFSYMRGMGGSCDHPSPLDIKYRIKWYILGKHSSAIFTEKRNTETEDSNENCLVQSSSIQDENFSGNMLANIFQGVNVHHNIFNSSNLSIHEADTEIVENYSFIEPDYPEIEILEDQIPQSHLNLLYNFEIQAIKDDISMEGLKYIAGYIAYRFRDKYKLSLENCKLNTNTTFDWISCISRGHLLYPNEELLETTITLEREFNSMHGNSLSCEKGLFKNLAQHTLQALPQTNNIPFDVILTLARTRTYIRLRELNRRLSYKNCQRKLHKNLSKFSNLKFH